MRKGQKLASSCLCSLLSRDAYDGIRACCELGVVRVSSEVGTREIPTARLFPCDAVVRV